MTNFELSTELMSITIRSIIREGEENLVYSFDSHACYAGKVTLLRNHVTAEQADQFLEEVLTKTSIDKIEKFVTDFKRMSMKSALITYEQIMNNFYTAEIVSVCKNIIRDLGIIRKGNNTEYWDRKAEARKMKNIKIPESYNFSGIELMFDYFRNEYKDKNHINDEDIVDEFLYNYDFTLAEKVVVMRRVFTRFKHTGYNYNVEDAVRGMVFLKASGASLKEISEKYSTGSENVKRYLKDAQRQFNRYFVIFATGVSYYVKEA